MKNSQENLNRDYAHSLSIDNLFSRMREELLALPYSSFLLVIAQLLERHEYRHVRLLERKGFVGRNRSGGWDLDATAPGTQAMTAGQAGPRCIIQVKQFDNLTVQQRSVDELRGCVLRAGAGMGLLITTSRFSPVAQQAAQASSLAPVVLLSGKELVSLLIQQKLGVCQKPNGKWTIDPEFFHSIREVETDHAQVNQAQVNHAQEAGAKQAAKRDRGQLLLSYSTSGYMPKNRQSPSPTPPKRHVLHLSIVLGTEPGGESKP